MYGAFIPSHANCPNYMRTILSALLGKTQVPHRIDKTHDKSLYRGGNPHLTSRFCKDELGLIFQHALFVPF
jgi:hypothetical protein